MCGKYAEAMSFAETLYSNTQYVDQLITDIGTGVTLDTSNLVFSFLDALCDEIGADKLLTFISNAAWKDYIKGKTVKPIIEHIQDAIDIGQKSKDKGAIARYEAGKFLIEDTKQLVLQLRNLLSPSEIQYQTIVDKLGLEILQCGIDYYNDSEEPDAAKKAMVLQSYAKSIVAGQMAKERCKENVDILQKTIDNLPPLEVFAEDCAIRKELRRYCSLPDEISYAIELLNNTKPLLQTIKEKLGKGNEYYLKMSTLVVSNALSNIIGEVNSSQDNNVLLRAWEAFKVMNSFDMESSFYNERYLKNYTTLRDLCKKQEIHEMKYKDGWVIICSIIIIEIIYLWLGYEEKMKGFLISLAGWFLFPINVILVLMVDAICKSIYRFYFYKSSATYKPVSLRKKIENAVEKEDIKKIGKKPKQNPITWAKKNPTCMVGIIFTAACTFLGGDINGGEGAFYGFFIAIGIIGGIASLLEDEL